jgi:hypothetical protein
MSCRTARPPILTTAMPWPQPTARAILVLHLAAGLPLIALAVWFGVVDSPASRRCASCGVEGYVIAAHVAAALWLGGVIAATAAARRQAEQGIAAPGRRTRLALGAAALFTLAALRWHALFGLPAVAGMAVSFFLGPAGALWWLLRTVAWLKRPAVPAQLQSSLIAAWIGLAVLLPGLFGWIWADRVQWLVF